MLIAAAHAAHADIRSAKQEWSKRLLGPTIQAEAMAHASARRITAAATTAPSRNVVGVGVAEKIVDGQPTGIMCVKFMVRVKYPSGQIARGERLPTQVDGIPVDVEQVGEFRKFAAKKKVKEKAEAL